MNATDYWPMAREYSVWNAVVAVLQFWTADLEAHVLSSTIEDVYTTFFYLEVGWNSLEQNIWLKF